MSYSTILAWFLKMSKDKEMITSIAHASREWANSPFPYLFGMGLMFFGAGIADRWDGHLVAQKSCYSLQEIQSKIFKVNTCTGNVEELASKK